MRKKFVSLVLVLWQSSWSASGLDVIKFLKPSICLRVVQSSVIMLDLEMVQDVLYLVWHEFFPIISENC